MRVPKGAPQVSGTAPLYGIHFAALLLVVFLGFASFSLVQPILPVLILEQGGDASTVGLVMLVFAVPSMLLRPFIGSLVDHWSRARTFMLGTTGLGLAGFLYLMPGLGPIFATRVLHGASWAAFNTAGSSTLAEIAPVLRRAEAAGIYTLVPNLAQMNRTGGRAPAPWGLRVRRPVRRGRSPWDRGNPGPPFRGAAGATGRRPDTHWRLLAWAH